MKGRVAYVVADLEGSTGAWTRSLQLEEGVSEKTLLTLILFLCDLRPFFSFRLTSYV